jgi:hypothetical protein
MDGTSMSFVERQNKNIAEVVGAATLERETPEALRTLEQNQRISAALGTCRCVRCGNAVVPLSVVVIPTSCICESCESEIRSWDKGAMVGSRWWSDIVNVQGRKP